MTSKQGKHTPGPWQVDGNASNSFMQIFVDDPKGGGQLAKVNRLGMSTHARFEELAANALLISKAPEMLDALRRLVNHAPCICGHVPTPCPTCAGEALLAQLDTKE